MKRIKQQWMKAVALLAWMPVQGAWAQAEGDTVLTLHDCMAYAVSHSTKMRLEAADRSDERWQRRQSILSIFTPQINGQVYAYNQYGRNLDPETNSYNSVTSFHNGYQVNAGITLFDGFQTINNLRIATTALRMGRSHEQQTSDEICLATMEAYTNVLYYLQLEAVLKEQVATAQRVRDRALRQEELGQKGHADVLQMESELAQKEYQLIAATNEKNEALNTLQDVMFWPVGTPLNIEQQLVEPTPMLASSADLATTAKGHLPSAEIASLELRKSVIDLQSARGAYSPTLSLQGGWSTTYYTYPGMKGYTPIPFREQFQNNAGEYVELSVSIPIYDQLRRRTNLQKKRNAVSRAQANYDKTMRDIEHEVARAINDCEGAQAAYIQAERLAALQEEAFRLSTRQYESGLISAIEYQTASQTYLKAMAERVKALLKYQIKNSVVRYYHGEPYINQ